MQQLLHRKGVLASRGLSLLQTLYRAVVLPYEASNASFGMHSLYVIINNLYVRYTRKHSKQSGRFVLYVDTSAELNVVFNVKIHNNFHQVFSKTIICNKT